MTRNPTCRILAASLLAAAFTSAPARADECRDIWTIELPEGEERVVDRRAMPDYDFNYINRDCVDFRVAGGFDERPAEAVLVVTNALQDEYPDNVALRVNGRLYGRMYRELLRASPTRRRFGITFDQDDAFELALGDKWGSPDTDEEKLAQAKALY